MMTRESLTAALRDVEGWLGEQEAWSLHRAVATFPSAGPVRVVEIGSWKGRSTVAVASAVAARPEGGVVHAIDPHRGGVPHRFFGEEDTFDQFLANVERAGLSGVVDPIRATSAAARAKVSDGSVHVLFVDGSHRLEDVRADIEIWEPSLCPGARIAFHDSVSYAGVVGALRERALKRGSRLRRPHLVQETTFFEYRPAEPWGIGDSARAIAMRAHVAGLRAAREAKSAARRLLGLARTG
jgi:predicted O-methyltransferase YrrM